MQTSRSSTSTRAVAVATVVWLNLATVWKLDGTAHACMTHWHYHLAAGVLTLNITLSYSQLFSGPWLTSYSRNLVKICPQILTKLFLWQTEINGGQNIILAELCLRQLTSVTLTHTHTHTHTHQFYDPFSSTIQVSQCQKKSSSGFYGAREDKQRQTHRPSSWAPLHPDQSAPTGCWFVWIEWRPAGPPTSIIPPPFCARYPSCRNPPTLSWLGTGTKYAGLHTQWRCETLNMCQFNFNNEWWSNASKQPARCPISQTVCMLDNALAYLVQPFEQVARLS